MRGSTLRRTSSVRQIFPGSLALAVAILPDPMSSIVAITPWEAELLRALALVGLSLIAALPWAAGEPSPPEGDATLVGSVPGVK